MGRAKALLPLGGETMIERLLSRLSGMVDERIVLTGPHLRLPDLPQDVRIHVDRTPLRGPLAALVDGLDGAGNEVCLTVACDHPFLNPMLARRLVEIVRDGAPAAVPEWNGRLQPLFAAYSRGVAPRLAERLRGGDPRLVEAVTSLTPTNLLPAEIRRIDPGGWSFFDLDTPEAYDLARRRAG